METAIEKAGGNTLNTQYLGVEHGARSLSYSNPIVWDWFQSSKKIKH